MLILGLFVLGLLIGPLLGVVVDRAVERERLVPQHRCQECGADLGSASLVPVASWFVACREDRAHKRWRYIAVDILTAISFAIAGQRFGVSFELMPYLLLFAALIVMSVIDFETHLLLNVLTFPTLLVGLVLVLVLSGSNGETDRIWPALTGAGVFLGILGAAFLAYPPGLGLGDVKLAPTLGLFLGWMTTEVAVALKLVFYAILLSFLVAGVLGLVINLIRRDRRAEIPLGPFLAGSVIVLVAVAPVSGLLIGQ